MNQHFLRKIVVYLCLQISIAGLAYTSLLANSRKPDNELTNETQSSQVITSLEAGKEIERDLQSGETHAYRISLLAGQFLHVVIDQRGIDVVVVLLGVNDNVIAQVDSPNGRQGVESLSVVVDVSGTYRLEIRALERDAPKGRYQLKIADLRTATPQDQIQVAAERAIQEGSNLRAQRTADSLRQSIEKFQAARSLYGGIGDSENLARMNLVIGRTYYEIGERRKALENLTEALSLFRYIKHSAGEALTLSNLGVVFNELGEKEKALEYFTEALALHRSMGDRSSEGTTFNSLGTLYKSLGKMDRALEYFQDALAIRRSLADRNGEVVVLSNLGAAYSWLGDKRRALDYYTQALAISRTLGDRSGEAVIFVNVGAIYDSFGEKQKALDYYEQALRIYRAVGDRSGEATTLNNIGTLYDSLGEARRGLEHYERALSLRQEVGDRHGEAVTLANIGAFYNAIGEKQKALIYYDRALRGMQDTGDLEGEGNVLSGIGAIHEDLNSLQAALDSYLQAISIRERLRAASPYETFRLRFDAESAELYQRAILIYLNTGKADRAFDLSERMRARTTLEQLTEARRSKSLPQITAREATLRQQISSLERELSEEKARADTNPDRNNIKEIETRLASKQQEYETFLVNEKLASPNDVSSRSANAALTVAGVQKFLRADMTLLSYLITPRKTVAFIISNDSFHAVELASLKESELFELIHEFRGFPSIKNWQREKLAKLHQYLVAPIRPFLKTPLVGIVPHGILHYIPFSMLWDRGRYFDEEHAVFYLPSASILPFILNNRKNNASLFAVAYSGRERFGKLRFADSEVRAITRIYKGHALTGDEATTGRVSALAGNYGILHLAAHFQLNAEHPLLSRVVLASEKNDDGFLEVHQVYELNLKKTDLVVLSASKTQLAKQTGGDDLIGMGSAFIYAGAASVIGSLWDVDDQATSIFMVSFYENLKQGMSKAEALRRAQIQTRLRYPHPYYWAAFVLMGDPGP